MRRRGAALCLLLGAGAASSCSRKEPPGAAQPSVAERAVVQTAGSIRERSPASVSATALPGEERTWRFDDPELGRMVAVVVVPPRAPGERLPVLLAFHGRGEARKGPERGARGWLDDYALGRAMARLGAPPLTRDDFESFVSAERLARINQSLRERPYRGLIVVCPYTPDALRSDRPVEKAPPLARFVTRTLLPRIERELPGLGADATGIDGVSLGGRAALGVGLLAPSSFRAIAGLQAAFDVDDAAELAELAVRARSQNPKLVFRLLTSHGDFFRDADTAIVRAMEARGVPAQLDLVEGPHDYAFNRGPGAIEMLLFHDRVLRGERPL